MKRLFHLNSALPGMLAGQAAYLVLGELILVLFVPYKAVCMVCFLAGVAYGALASIHMSYVLEQVTYLDSRSAVGRSLKGYSLRLALMAAVLLLCCWWDVRGMFAALAGMFSMKVSAYLQPFTDKAIQKIYQKGR